MRNGLTIKEAADIMGIKPITLRMHIYRSSPLGECFKKDNLGWYRIGKRDFNKYKKIFDRKGRFDFGRKK